MSLIAVVIVAFGPYCSVGCLQELSRHPDPRLAFQVVPRYNPTSLFWPPDCAVRCLVGSLAFSFPVGPGHGLICGTGHWLSEGVSNPSPVSLEDLIFCWLLLGPFSEFSFADGLRPSDPKDSSMAGVDECLDLLQCHSCDSPCISSGLKKILMLMLMVRLGETQMFFIWRKAALALLILTFTSASVPPCFQQYYLGRWNFYHLLMHLDPVLWVLCWLLCCSWGPCS